MSPSRRQVAKARRLAADINARFSADDRVTAETEALYRSLPKPALVVLCMAFTLDRDHAPTLSSRAFCEGRIELIERVLSEASVPRGQVSEETSRSSQK